MPKAFIQFDQQQHLGKAKADEKAKPKERPIPQRKGNKPFQIKAECGYWSRFRRKEIKIPEAENTNVCELKDEDLQGHCNLLVEGCAYVDVKSLSGYKYVKFDDSIYEINIHEIRDHAFIKASEASKLKIGNTFDHSIIKVNKPFEIDIFGKQEKGSKICINQDHHHHWKDKFGKSGMVIGKGETKECMSPLKWVWISSAVVGLCGLIFTIVMILIICYCAPVRQSARGASRPPIPADEEFDSGEDDGYDGGDGGGGFEAPGGLESRVTVKQ